MSLVEGKKQGNVAKQQAELLFNALVAKGFSEEAAKEELQRIIQNKVCGSR